MAPQPAPLSTPRVPIIINPAIYPQGPGGTVVVANAVIINVDTADFRRLTEVIIPDLIEKLRGSNEPSPEVRKQLTGELRAGVEIISTPKPSRGAIEAYLLRPLQFISKEFTSGVIRTLAVKALELLAKLVGSYFS
jgi:hypothetical protein